MSIAAMLGIVAVLALGLAAMRIASRPLADAVLVMAYAVLVLATLAAAIRGRRAAACIGFAVFGWATFLPVYVIGTDSSVVLTATILVEEFVLREIPLPKPPPGVRFVRDEPWGKNRMTRPYHTADWDSTNPPEIADIENALRSHDEKLKGCTKIAHTLLTLILASIGAVAGRTFSAWGGTDIRPPS